MKAAGGLNDVAHLAVLERKRSVLKLGLHVALAKKAQVTSLSGGGAVGLRHCKVADRGLAGLDLGLVRLENGPRLLLGPLNVGVLPRRRPSRVSVLDEQMRHPDVLARAVAGARGRVGHGCVLLRVVGRHVLLQQVRVGAGRRLPRRVAGGRVEVVGQVTGSRVAHLPAGNEACGRIGRLC